MGGNGTCWVGMVPVGWEWYLLGGNGTCLLGLVLVEWVLYLLGCVGVPIRGSGGILQVDVKPAVPKNQSQGPDGQNGVETVTRTKKIFLGGLKPDVTKEDIEAVLGYDKLSDAVVMTDQTTKKSRGFGFATFNTFEEASEFMKGNRSIRITIKVTDELVRNST